MPLSGTALRTLFLYGALMVILSGAALLMVWPQTNEHRQWLQTPKIERRATLGPATSDCVRRCPENPPVTGPATLKADPFGPETQITLRWQPAPGSSPQIPSGQPVTLSCSRDRPWVCRQPEDQAYQNTRKTQTLLAAMMGLGLLAAGSALHLSRHRRTSGT